MERETWNAPLAASVLWWAAIAHSLNDGLEAAVTPLLPFIAADLALSYGEAGAVKSALNALISLSQLPAGFLAARFGEAAFLGVGLGWLSASFLLMGLAGSYLLLLLLMASAGIGGGVYHPVGTAWVSRVFWGRQRGAAVGTLNFSGDVGKVVLPALAGLLAVSIGWRGGLVVLGAVGVIVAVAFLVWARFFEPPRRQERQGDEDGENSSRPSRLGGSSFVRLGIARPRQFALICAIGLLDQAQRSAVLAFLGFLLLQKGQPEASLGWLVAVTLAGGAFGKFGCGLLTDRFEDRRVMDLTETAMAIGALLLAVREGTKYRYVGKVGTGFSQASLEDLAKRLPTLSGGAPVPPTAEGTPTTHSVRWLKPELVCQIRFREWTREGALRHPTFEGLREDKAAESVVREEPDRSRLSPIVTAS